MNSLYEVLIDLSKRYCKFSGKNTGFAALLKFDLKNKTIKNRNTYIIKKGKTAEFVKLNDGTEYSLKDIPIITGNELKFLGIDDLFSDPYKVIEHLYSIYYTSVPNEKSVYSRCNFEAANVDDLSFEQLRNNLDRITAQYVLEGYILLMSILGKIEWKNDSHFYWQSPIHKKLIIFKEWIK